MTMTKKYIEDKDGNQVLPITHLSAVKDSNGNTLEDILWEEKEYDPTHYSGMGKVVLQKNMVSGVNTLTQSMISASNTIYVIQYDFTLASDVTVPAGCILEFEGGRISNGAITFNNTLLLNTNKQSINNCRLDGTVSNDYIDVTHLGVSSSLTDCSTLLNDIMQICTGNKKQKIYIPAGKYTTLHPIIPCSNIEIFGDGEGTEIYNAQTTGSDKHVFVCSSFPAVSTGAARNLSYTKYAISAISEDRRTITAANGHGALVGELGAVFGNQYIQSSSPTNYWYFTYVGKIIDVSGNDITFDEPIPNVNVSDMVFAPKASGSDQNAWYRENVHIHDIFLNQLTGVESGYYAIASGYKCVFENLKIHSSTPVGSNLSSHCVYRNIDADCEAGMWDDAELIYDNLYENITVTRYDARLNVIAFNVTNGSFNRFKNIHLIGNLSIGGTYTSYHVYENIEFVDCAMTKANRTTSYIVRGNNAVLRGIKFTNISIVYTGTGGTTDNLLVSNSSDVEGVCGNITCTNVTPQNRLPNALAPVNVQLNKEFHIGNTVYQENIGTLQYGKNTYLQTSIEEWQGNGEVFVFPINILDNSVHIHSKSIHKMKSGDNLTNNIFVLYLNTASGAWNSAGYTFPIGGGDTESKEMVVDFDAVVSSNNCEYRIKFSAQDYEKVVTSTVDISTLTQDVKKNCYIHLVKRTDSGSVQSTMYTVYTETKADVI